MIKKVHVLLIFSSLFIFGLFISAANAQVTQETGLLDVEFGSLNKQICQECHGTYLADTHHETPDATAGNCTLCHSVSTEPETLGVTLVRDCMVCHLETPHHKTDLALNNQCTACHDTPGLNDYSLEVAPYPISRVTPAIDNCKRCHSSGELNGLKIVDFTDTHHEIALDNCTVCHESTETMEINIRSCERCHNQKVIHQVANHIEEQNCKECHLSQ